MAIFGRSERENLRAFVEWAVPAQGARAEEVVDWIDAHFSETSREPRMFVKGVLFAVGQGARLRWGKPLAALDAGTRDRYLKWWLAHRSYALRSLAKVVLLEIEMAYYSRPAVRDRFGFRPDDFVALREKLRIVDPRAVPPPAGEDPA